MPIIEIKNLTYFYPGENKPALNSINLSIEEGEFVLLAGGSGSGKSSLVRAMTGLIPEFYGGRIGGAIILDGRLMQDMKRKEIVKKIGMVFQDPESQLVMTNVEQELAFGMENLGLHPELMKRRIMEVSGALSLHPYLKDSIPELSGGLKQKVLLASILAMQPDILILDEPTSQLDPVAGEEILTMIRRLNEDNGITVILIEQRLERCFHLSDRILIMDKGRVIYNGIDREETAKWAAANNNPFIPPLSKIFAAVGSKQVPMTVKEGRRIIKNLYHNNKIDKNTETQIFESADNRQRQPLIEAEKIWFSYGNGSEILKNIELTIYPSDFIAVMGENAAGKTTLLKNLRGLLTPARGRIKINGRDIKELNVEAMARMVGYLSQNPNDYLFRQTVEEEIAFTLENLGIEKENRVDELLGKFALKQYKEVNPRDLSTGERQRAALAAILAADPLLIILDEPTRGLDYEMKASLGELLTSLQKEGHAVLVVTHDVEFAAEYAEEIVLMSRGQIISRGKKRSMLSHSTFYSSQIGKLFYQINDSVVTMQDGEKELYGYFNNTRGNDYA